MLTITDLADAYRRNLEIIKLQVAGLSQQESLIQLPFRANCLNWILGHILTNRLWILEILGVEGQGTEIDLDHYQRESDPILGPGEGVLELSELLAYLETSQGRLEAALAKEDERSLQRPGPPLGDTEHSVSSYLFFLYFHDCYHVGQTEILRQAAGKDDKII
jgi:hypothetical protein